jgi:Sodium/hydrogen exchanger family
MHIPYPALLALGGVALAISPITIPISLDPELVLALLVAPALVDAAYDVSFHDLKAYWVVITCLVFFAVGLTTAAVAIVARQFVPDLPWGAAIALGAIVAPPDAAAVTGNRGERSLVAWARADLYGLLPDERSECAIHVSRGAGRLWPGADWKVPHGRTSGRFDAATGCR